MMRRMAWGGVLVVLGCGGGCAGDEAGQDAASGGTGGGSGAATFGTCDRKELMGGCIESTGSAVSIRNQKAGCEDAGGLWTSDACPSADLVGCCEYTFGLDFRECWYTNTATTDPEASCATMDGSVWIPAGAGGAGSGGGTGTGGAAAGGGAGGAAADVPCGAELTCTGGAVCIEEVFAASCTNLENESDPCPSGQEKTLCGGAGIACCCEPPPASAYSCVAPVACTGAPDCSCLTCPEDKWCTGVGSVNGPTFRCDLPAMP